MRTEVELLLEEARTPYARGEADGLAGRPGPAFPKATSPWSDKLYNRGWEAGITQRAIRAALGQPIEAAL
jgi:hypothetical protein